MLHLARKICGAPLLATDGEIGTIEDFFFEDDRWTVRYLLVNTGKWLSGKRVLLSPMSVVGPWSVTGISVGMDRDRVWNSPSFEPQATLSRAQETTVLGYYGYPYYWGYSGVWGTFDNPGALVTAPPSVPPDEPTHGIDPEAQHLRSINHSTGYHLHATDGDIGHVDDFLIGEDSWRIRYLLVDTSNWIGGRSMIVASDVVEHVDREHEKLLLSVSRDAIKNGPSFESIELALDVREIGPAFTII
jgi:uncharacterized protein YrrD